MLNIQSSLTPASIAGIPQSKGASASGDGFEKTWNDQAPPNAEPAADDKAFDETAQALNDLEEEPDAVPTLSVETQTNAKPDANETEKAAQTPSQFAVTPPDDAQQANSAVSKDKPLVPLENAKGDGQQAPMPKTLASAVPVIPAAQQQTQSPVALGHEGQVTRLHPDIDLARIAPRAALSASVQALASESIKAQLQPVQTPQTVPQDERQKTSAARTLLSEPIGVEAQRSATIPSSSTVFNPAQQNVAFNAALLSQQMIPEGSISDGPLPEGEVLQQTVPNTATHSRALPAHPLQAHAPQASQQIVQAVVQSKGGTTEIALNPAELGRVRIALTPTEAGITVSILAERPETTDLIRRNIENLAQDFHAMGFEDVAFSFGDQADGSGEQPNDTPPPAAPKIPLAEPAAPSAAMNVVLHSGLDLKL